MLLAEAKDTNRAYLIMEQVIPKGPQAVVHLHETQDQAQLVQRLLNEVGCRLKDHGGPLGGAPGAMRGGTLT